MRSLRTFRRCFLSCLALAAVAACSKSDGGTGPGLVDHIVFLIPPSQTRSGQPITPGVQVALVDASGNIVTTATDFVTIALAAPIPAGGALTGTLKVQAVAGVASFTNLQVSPVGTGYSVSATSGSFPVITSDPFNVYSPMPMVATSIAIGRSWSCALTSAGAYCWGHDGGGELGINSDSNRFTPSAVLSGGLVFTQLSAGSSETCSLIAGGAAYCWGHNDFGGVGDGTQNTQLTPVAVSGSHAFTTISDGEDTGCGLVATGAAYCWGYNARGQVGNGSTTLALVPDSVHGGPYASISAGASFTCALTSAGKAYCWGMNFSGNLGDSTFVDKTTPVAVAGGLVFSVIESGGTQTCGLLASTGAAYCWGDGSSGQVGDGSMFIRSAPVAVSGGLFFSALAAGGNHTCGIEKSTGLAFCWGFNDVGQLGDGTTVSKLVPTPVSGGHKFDQLGAGYEHVCGLVTGTGAILCWGGNSIGGGGALGNGTMNGSLVPAAVVP